VIYGSEGEPYTVAYQELPVLLLALAQQQHRIDALSAQNRLLQHQQAQVGSLQARLARIERALQHR
jgi:hypothetical protein